MAAELRPFNGAAGRIEGIFPTSAGEDDDPRLEAEAVSIARDALGCDGFGLRPTNRLDLLDQESEA
jgi:hypothetical protein